MDRRNHCPRGGGGNIAVFRNSPLNGGTGAYFRFDDSSNSNYRPVTFKAFSSMSDINTGVNGTALKYTFRTGTNINTNYTPLWTIIADEYTCYVNICRLVDDNTAHLSSFGDIEAFASNDAFKYYVAGRSSVSPGSGGSSNEWLCYYNSASNGPGLTTTNLNPGQGVGFANDWSGLSGQIGYGMCALGFSSSVLFGNGAVSTTSPPPNISTEFVYPAFLAANYHFRSKMRGVLLPTASVESLDNLYVKINGFDGVNDVICLKSLNNSGIWIEFNKEWPS